MITSEEIVAVMSEEDVQPYTKQSIDGPALSMQIPYEKGSAFLSTEAKLLVDIVGWALKSERLKDAHFEVIGHTDSTGDKALNLELSKFRARVVKEYLVQVHQIDESRLRSAFLGDSQPLGPNTTKIDRAVNRRVEFRRLDWQ